MKEKSVVYIVYKRHLTLVGSRLFPKLTEIARYVSINNCYKFLNRISDNKLKYRIVKQTVVNELVDLPTVEINKEHK